MRRSLVVLGGLLLAATPAAAQYVYPRGLRPARSEPRVELSPFVNYQWGGQFDVSYQGSYGEINIDDSEAFGAALDIKVRPGAKAELYYSYQPTTLRFRSGAGVQQPVFDLGVHYMHVGGTYEMDRGSPVRPFGTFTLGTTLFDPRGDVPYGSEWRFSMRFGLGVKLMANDRIGLRAEGNLLLPFLWNGTSGMWCTPGFCTVALTGGTAIVQGSVGGGLTVAF